MPKRCLVCANPRRARFERLVRDAVTIAAAARETRLPYQSAKRHVSGHMGAVASFGSGAPPAARSGRSSSREVVARVARAKPVPSDPVATFRAAYGHDPIAWQVAYLAETRPLVLLKGRQIGASTAAGALAIDTARAKPGSLTAIVSPTLKQSIEITRKARWGLLDIGEDLDRDSESVLQLANGSRILSLPGTDRAVRGWSADLLIIDEAAFVDEATWEASRATVAATGGRTIVQSTPDLPDGAFFHRLATSPPEGWARMVVRSDEAETIDPAFLAGERAALSPTVYAREYEATFATPGTLGALWSEDEWKALIRAEEET